VRAPPPEWQLVPAEADGSLSCRRALGGAAGAAAPPPPVKLEFPAAERPSKKPKVEAEGAAAAAPAPPAPPAVKLEDDDGHPAVKLEDEDGDPAAAAPPFVPPPFVPPAPPPLVVQRRCGKGLGNDRQTRRAQFYQGVFAGTSPDVYGFPGFPLRPPGVANIKIHDDLSVVFKSPHVPTEPQMQVMTTLAKALIDGKHCIVEAPTGTGKTAAVFTPLLAFQEQQELLHGKSNPSLVPRIIYVARTLPQLDKAGMELATYPYNTLLAAPVGKEHLCMQPKEEGISRTDQCRKLCKPLSMTVRLQKGLLAGSTGCEFLNLQNQLDLPQHDIEQYVSGGSCAGRTVAEVVEKARHKGICAYHVSRDLTNTAGASVVMLTYGQLFDPHLRACNKTDALLKGALVFIDEAHNVPDVCRKAASEALNSKQLQALADEAKEQLQMLADARRNQLFYNLGRHDRALIEDTPHLLVMLTKLIDYIAGWLDMQSKNPRLDWATDGFTQTASQGGTYTEDLIYSALSSCGALLSFHATSATDDASAPLSPSAAAALGAAGSGRPPPRTGRSLQKVQAREVLESFSFSLESVEDALDVADSIRSAVGAPISKGKRTRRFGTMLSKLALCVGSDAACFELSLRRLSKDGEEEHRKNNADVTKLQLPELNIVCLSGSVAMQRVLELARCAVFASGTLGAALDFSLEIGLGGDAFCAVSTDHLQNVKTQLLPVVYTGRRPQLLRITAEKQERGKNEQFGKGVIDEAGDVLLRCAANVPGGILVFFGSKHASDIFRERWYRKGTMQRLAKLLPSSSALIVDEADTPEDAALSLDQYCNFANKPSINGKPTAIMLSVLRGRCAEGADFKDHLARAVFVIGVPLSPFKDPFVEAKKRYDDSITPNGGQRWYYSEAARCAAQAAGRVFRHAGDYGVVVLLDGRYARVADDSVKRFLPRYLQNLLQEDTDPQMLADKLKPFFQRCAALPAPPPAGGVKRER